jgi:hypothetical protein
LAALDPSDPPIPSPQADDEGQAAAETPALEVEAAKAASGDPTVVDPQLRKAVEYLEEQIGGSAKGPGRA